MKISAVISRDIINRSNIIKDRINIIIFSVMVLALLSGTIIFMFSESFIVSEMSESFLAFYTDFSAKSKIEVFSGIFLTYFPIIILMIILGSCSFGYLLIPILGYLKVTGIGVLSAYLYSSFGLKGLEYSLLIFYPGKFLMLFSLMFLMHSCIDNSLVVKSLIRGDSRAENNDTLYGVRIALAVIILSISSLIDCVLAVSFSSLFSF